MIEILLIFQSLYGVGILVIVDFVSPSPFLYPTPISKSLPLSSHA